MSRIPAFAMKFRVVAPDHRGCDLSDKPKGPPSIRMMAEDAVALLDHLSIEKTHVVGDSMGGWLRRRSPPAGRSGSTGRSSPRPRGAPSTPAAGPSTAAPSRRSGTPGDSSPRSPPTSGTTRSTGWAPSAPRPSSSPAPATPSPPEQGRLLAERIPGARLLVMRGTHWLVWEGGPMLAAEVERFLSEPAQQS